MSLYSLIRQEVKRISDVVETAKKRSFLSFLRICDCKNSPFFSIKC